ncbi:MAG: hypothetical protein IPM97_01370 [Bdellovibrionaceae bacterium]|nr:hypothetical protein [Pseudobdellovibrionaceae bacterium]
MKNLILMMFLMLSLTACAGRSVKILDANWASMKHSMPPSPKDKLVAVTNVNMEYCMEAWSGSFGLMDEVVKKVELNYNIDYIKYPSFTQTQGRPCVQVSGEGYRVAR